MKPYTYKNGFVRTVQVQNYSKKVPYEFSLITWYLQSAGGYAILTKIRTELQFMWYGGEV